MPLVLSLHWAQGLAFARAQVVWTRHGLTPAEFDVLATLRNAPAPHELTPSQLRASMMITSGGLTKVMAQLEAGGLVSRSRPAGDQRVKPVKLTPAGRERVELAMAEVAASAAAWLGNVLDPAEISRLAELLRKLAGSGTGRAA